jgi:hypothetical protein
MSYDLHNTECVLSLSNTKLAQGHSPNTPSLLGRNPMSLPAPPTHTPAHTETLTDPPVNCNSCADTGPVLPTTPGART